MGSVPGGRYPYTGAVLALAACMYFSDSEGAYWDLWEIVTPHCMCRGGGQLRGSANYVYICRGIRRGRIWLPWQKCKCKAAL